MKKKGFLYRLENNIFLPAIFNQLRPFILGWRIDILPPPLFELIRPCKEFAGFCFVTDIRQNAHWLERSDIRRIPTLDVYLSPFEFFRRRPFLGFGFKTHE